MMNGAHLHWHRAKKLGGMEWSTNVEGDLDCWRRLIIGGHSRFIFVLEEIQTD
jgi:hypothetical protein